MFNLLQIVNTARAPVHAADAARLRAAGRRRRRRHARGLDAAGARRGQARDRQRPVRARRDDQCSSPIRCRSTARPSRSTRSCRCALDQRGVIAQKIGDHAARLAADRAAARDAGARADAIIVGQGPGSTAGERADARPSRACRITGRGRATWRSALAALILAAGVWAAVATGPRRCRHTRAASSSSAPARPAVRRARRARGAAARARRSIRRATPRGARELVRALERRLRASSDARTARPALRTVAASGRDVRLRTSPSLTLTDVSRHFGRRRALDPRLARCDAGRSSRCSGRTAPASPRSLHRRHAARAVVGRRALRRAARPAAAGAALRGAHRPARPRSLPLSRADRGENLRFFARLYGLPDVERAGRRGARARRARRAARRSGRRASRAACASGWRSSARCCTSRGWCCSTSRSPASTTRRRARCDAAGASCAPAAASCCSRRTTSRRSRRSSTGRSMLQDGRLVDVRAGRGLAARALSRRAVGAEPSR